MRENQEIPKEHWANYLDALSNREKNRAVNVRVEGVEYGDQPLSRGMNLVGISCEEKGSEKDAVEITLACGEFNENITHMVRHPEHIYIEEGDDGQVKVVDIEDVDHVKTLIFFDTSLDKALP